MSIRGRIPVIALDYADKYKAVTKEIMVDYETGNIYIVSADDKNVIFDITSKIKENLEGITGGQIVINVEGVGDVNLTEILKQMQLEIKSTIQVVDDGANACYVGKDRTLDNRSIDSTDLLIQVKGFAKAEDLQMPRKRNGEIEWVDVTDVFTGMGNDGTGGGGDIIPPSNPNDGLSLSCFIIEPVNGVLYLRASKRQKSKNLAVNCKVILPRVLDEYSEIKWYVITNNFAPKLDWSNNANIVWKNNARQLSTNSHCIFRAETWDYGQNWIAVLETYDAQLPENGIDKTYLDENYYNKTQINNNFPTNDKLKEYISKEEASTTLVSQTQLQDGYYDKDEVDNFLSFEDYK